MKKGKKSMRWDLKKGEEEKAKVCKQHMGKGGQGFTWEGSK